MSDSGQLKVGERFHDFSIEGEFVHAENSFFAMHHRLMERVVVREFRVTPANEWRRGAWEQLCTLSDSKVVRCIEAHEEDGWRYEVSTVPPAMTMREWMACRRPSFADIEGFMRQMAATLGLLHGQGVVHLNIRPESIFIDETRGEPVYLLGGLSEVTLYTQSDVEPADVDPRYAPPEAAGVKKHAAGTRLCAWDWWSVGRVVQEFLIGHHVFAMVFERDVSRMTPELRAMAELLLLEKKPTGVRAGALDFTMVDATCMQLLRGLLTSSCDARWGLDAVQRWLRREPVREHYDLPRYARLWNWRGRGMTVGEAAEFFTQAKQWEIGEDMLFHPHEPETLAHFLKEVPTHREDWERLQAVCDLAESRGWEQLPVVARRTVIAALAWLSLSCGAGTRTNLRVRGEPIDLTGLGDLLKKAGPDLGVALLSALLSPPVIQFVEPLDATAARVLKTMAAKAGDAVQRAQQHGWLDPHDGAGHARMFELALQSGAALREKVDLLRAAYATNSNEALAQVFTNKTLEPSDLVVLAFTGEAPEKHGYITHENWRRQRCAALKAEGERAVTVLFWLRLRQLLSVARLWGAPSPVFAGTVLVLTAAAGAISRQVEPTAAVAAALLLSRVWLWWRVRTMAASFDATSARWGWRDGGRRAAEEAARASGNDGVTIASLTERLQQVRTGLAELAAKNAPSPRVKEPQWWDLPVAIAVAVVVTVASLAHPWWREPAPVREKAVAIEATGNEAADADANVDAETSEENGARLPAPLGLEALIATGRYEVVDDGFGRRLRGPLEKWERFAPASFPRVEITARAPVTPEQSAFAVVSGTLLLQPYARRAVSVKLALRVPTTRGFGVVLFNTRDRELVEREVFLVREPLVENTWYHLGSHRVLYLGAPLPMDAEISLAPP